MSLGTLRSTAILEEHTHTNPPSGANSPLGIGRAAAHQFAAHGAAAVYICDYDGSHLAAHAAEMTRLFPGVDVQTRVFDAADEDKVKGVVGDAMERHGRLDVFFANAGISGGAPLFTEIETEDFERLLKTNVLG